ncbi:Glucosyltransferase-like protein [Gaertneriomyces sp. JEL0708]|nr:Glucosyltransferase-like protein [Gaertneriomyces sp. JEL0708]
MRETERARQRRPGSSRDALAAKEIGQAEGVGLASPALYWFKLLRSTGGSHLALLSIYLFAIFIRWTVGLSGYSGRGVPPLYGDFEAQRHWMELTVNLPPGKWYWYDPAYWGLDYPPITAYHSWIMGTIARTFIPQMVELYKSRGIETLSVKVFMRLSALITEFICYVPAVVFFVNRWTGQDQWLRKPSLIIIDHGHFQYNTAMLGFTLWSILFLSKGYYVLGSIAFCLALGFKQMALFYALPIFFYLLGHCYRRGPRRGLQLLVKLGLSVVTSFLVMLAPFLRDTEQLLQVFRRVFPLHRGLYEDKVANVWCALSVILKLRSLFTVQTLLYISLFMTLMCTLPAALNLFLNPTPRRLIYALLNGSLAFFLFSFQVHEKSILLPLLPAMLLLLEEPFMVVWFGNVAMFSMYPLLKRDELALPYALLLVLFNLMASFAWRRSAAPMPGLWLLKMVSYAAMLSVHILDITVPPPPRLPDIYTMANVGLSTALFVLFLAYFNFRQFALVTDGRAGAALSAKLKGT